MSQGSRHIEVIYCDDIREEVGHKMSYMGVYSGELSVPSAPVLLTKLCIAVKVVTDITDPFTELEVRIVKGEDDLELITTGKILGPVDMAGFDNGSTRMLTQMAFMLAPFQIEEETILRVVAKTEREELRGIALRIRITPPLTQTVQ